VTANFQKKRRDTITLALSEKNKVQGNFAPENGLRPREVKFLLTKVCKPTK